MVLSVLTVTNLAVFKQDISDSFSLKAQTDIIYTNFNKAFDQIDHNLLTLKLTTINYGFNDLLLSRFILYWFYLKDNKSLNINIFFQHPFMFLLK